MKFITVVNNAALTKGGISKFTFTAVRDIYDCEVVLESRGYKKLIVELDFVDKTGLMKCLRIANGRIRIATGTPYGPEPIISENHLLIIMLSTIELNNLILNVDHVMRGDSIYEFNSEYTYMVSDYLQRMVNVVNAASLERHEVQHMCRM